MIYFIHVISGGECRGRGFSFSFAFYVSVMSGDGLTILHT
jgi:hypothetical protein